jgi:BMFP domain-containing protein YqiC
VQSPQQLFQLIQDQVAQLLPDVTKMAQEEVSTHLRSVISGVIAKLDLVSRDEFEAQQAVLERTRSKLEQLEKAFAELERRFPSNPD